MSTTNELLQEGIQAAKDGQMDEARQILKQVIEQEPHNETAWLWLSGAVETDDQRIACLENVLAINPHHEAARRGLQALRQKAAVKPLPEMPPPSPATERPKPVFVLSREAMGCSIILLLLLIVVIALALHVDRSMQSGSPASPAQKPTPTHDKWTSIGAHSILHVDGGPTSYFVAVNEEARKKLFRAIDAKDDYGMAELLLTGQVFSVKDGTEVLVIDMALFTTRIRVLEGPHTGKSGWVPDEWVAIK